MNELINLILHQTNAQVQGAGYFIPSAEWEAIVAAAGRLDANNRGEVLLGIINQLTEVGNEELAANRDQSIQRLETIGRAVGQIVTELRQR